MTEFQINLKIIKKDYHGSTLSNIKCKKLLIEFSIELKNCFMKYKSGLCLIFPLIMNSLKFKLMQLLKNERKPIIKTNWVSCWCILIDLKC